MSLQKYSKVTEVLHPMRGRCDKRVLKANLQVQKGTWCLTEPMILTCLSPEVSLSKSIFRLKRMKEQKGLFFFFFTSVLFQAQITGRDGKNMYIWGKGWNCLGNPQESEVIVLFIEFPWPSQIVPAPQDFSQLYFLPIGSKLRWS